MPDFTPAPGSTATSAPNALNFLTVSGVPATRVSAESISAAIAIFMMPPAAGQPRASLLRVAGDHWKDGFGASGAARQGQSRRKSR
jgi:hypothetical protein